MFGASGTDSNPQPAPYKGAALPIELRKRNGARDGFARPPDIAAGFFLRSRNYPIWQGTSFIVAGMSELFRPSLRRAIEPARPEPRGPSGFVQPICDDVIRHISTKILAFSRLI